MPRVVFGVTVPVSALVFLKGQLSELIRCGWETHLVTSPGSELVEFRSMPGLHVHEIRMHRDPAPLHDVISLIRWWVLLRSLKPDVVVASTPKASLLGIMAAWFQRIPARVYHVRGLRAEGEIGLLRHLSLLAERISVSLASLVVADSPSLLTQMQVATGLKQAKGTVLGLGSSCGVNTERFRPPNQFEFMSARAAFGIAPDNTFVVGFVGRITRDKGIVELVDAIKLVRHKNLGVHLVLTGPIEELELVRILEEDWITATMSFGDPLATYWASDVMCFPSYREGFPIAPLEAQSCGVPVVTTTATGAIDSVRDHKTGILVEPSDAEQLSEAITSLLVNQQARFIMGKTARKWVQSHFEAQVVQRRWADLIASSVTTQKHE